MENRSPTLAAGGKEKGLTEHPCYWNSPWDGYYWWPTHYMFPFSPLLLKLWHCFLWAMYQGSAPITGSCSQGWQNYTVLAEELQVKFCWVSGKDLPTWEEGTKRLRQLFWLLFLPWLWPSCLVAAAILWRWGSNQETQLTSLIHGPSAIAICFWMSRWCGEKNSHFIQSTVCKAFFYLQPRALLIHNLTAFLWQKRKLWKPNWKKQTNIFFSLVWIMCRNGSGRLLY